MKKLKLKGFDNPLFTTLEAEQLKSILGGNYLAGTHTEDEVKITSGTGGCGCSDSSAQDPEQAGGDDGDDGSGK